MYRTIDRIQIKTMTKPTLYLSFDVETDGNNPMLNSMISIGFYGLTDTMNEVFKYSANIIELPGHTQDKQCMETFWNKPENKTAWDYTQQNKRSFTDVMLELSDNFTRLSQQYKLVFVAHPANFDWMFLKNYYELAKHALYDPAMREDPMYVHPMHTMYDIGYTCQCSSTLWGLCKEKFKWSSEKAKKLYNEFCESDPTKEHFAFDDAMNQGIGYVKIRKLLLQ
jgi:hypothetical protein